MASYLPTDPNVPVRIHATEGEPKRVSAANVSGNDVVVFVGGDNTVSGASHTSKLNAKQAFVEVEEDVWVVGGRGVLVETLVPNEPQPGLLHDNKQRRKKASPSSAKPKRSRSSSSKSKSRSKSKSSAKK